MSPKITVYGKIQDMYLYEFGKKLGTIGNIETSGASLGATPLYRDNTGRIRDDGLEITIEITKASKDHVGPYTESERLVIVAVQADECSISKIRNVIYSGISKGGGWVTGEDN